MDLTALIYLGAITLLPGIELRGAIPYGIGVLQLDWFFVFLFCTAVNILLVFPVYFFLEFIFPFFESLTIIQPLLAKVRNKTDKYVEKYGFWGLMLFVAVPLPGSGVYSGALGAHLLKIKKRHAIPAISCGAIIAGILITLASVGVLSFLI